MSFMCRLTSSRLVTVALLAFAALVLFNYMIPGAEAASGPPTAKRPPPKRRPPPKVVSKPPPKSRPPPKVSSKPPPRSPPPSRLGLPNVRLVRGSNSMGRLEVLYSDYSSQPSWRPVCNDGSFNPDDAQVFCTFLGYQYGVPYRKSGVSTFTPTEKKATPQPIRPIECDFFTYDLTDPNGHRRFRQYPRFMTFVSFGDQSCGFDDWTCGADSQLVALQCSDTPLPPLPSPPPRPPTPPPPPPDMTNAIKLIFPEPNLVQETCAHFGPSNMFYRCGRVELLVKATPTGPLVWAPLCADSSGELSYEITRVACNQAIKSTLNPNVEFVSSQPTDAIKIPTGRKPGSGNFSASDYRSWVSVVGDISGGLHAIQAMKLEVSSKPCKSGYMAAIACPILIA